MNAALETIQAEQTEIRDLLNKALQTNSKSLEKLEFYGEIWISAIRRNRDQLDRVEKATSEIIHRLDTANSEIKELKKLIQDLLRKRIQPGLLQSDQFAQLVKEVSATQNNFEKAQLVVKNNLDSLEALNSTIYQNPTLSESLRFPIANTRNSLEEAQLALLVADKKCQIKKQELKEFLQALLAIQEQIIQSTSERAIKARSLFELGDFIGADKSLDANELYQDKEYLLQQKNILRNHRKQLAEDFILKANLNILQKEDSWLQLAFKYFRDATEIDESYTTYEALAFFLMTVNSLDNAIIFFSKTLQFTSDLVDRAQVLRNLGVLFKNTAQSTFAEQALLEALDIYKELSKDSKNIYLLEMANVFNSLGNLYRHAEHYEDAKQSYTKALKLCRKSSKGDQKIYWKNSIYIYNNLAVLYANIKQYVQAEKVLKKTLKYFESINDNLGARLENLSVTYLNLGNIYSDTERLD